MATYNLQLDREEGFRLQVRIGIHTGPVVIGDVGAVGRHEQLALGETPNVAARTQSLAGADQLLITGATHRLAGPFFSCEDLGLHGLRGVARAVRLFRVLGESGVRSRMDVARVTGMTPLVGRTKETRLLLDRWARARSGRGQAVLMLGEPGIGKSRQVLVVKEHLEAEPYVLLESRCSPYLESSAFAPVVESLRGIIGLESADGADARLRQIAAALDRAGIASDDAVALVAALLDVPAGSYQLPDASPQLLRQMTLELLATWALAFCNDGPVLLIAEDLHWSDPSTLELLRLLLERSGDKPMLLLLVARPEFQLPWPSDRVEILRVGPLGAGEASQLVDRVAHGVRLPPELVDRVVGQTDGVPLFIEELTKMMLESGLVTRVDDRYELSGTIPESAIPTTVQDSLMARLDRLGEAKTVAQVASVIGRGFRYDLLRELTSLDDGVLQRSLGALTDAGLVTREGIPPRATYLFNHALIQDAAHGSLLKRARQDYHRRIAGLYVSLHPEVAEATPEVVARHFAEGGLAREAIQYWLKAGQRATARSADLEAISHLRRGRDLLPLLPDGAERQELELMLELSLGTSLLRTQSNASPAVEVAFGRARELCGVTGNRALMEPALYGLWAYYISRAEYESAYQMSEQMLALGTSLGDDSATIAGHCTSGYNHFYGWTDLDAAIRHLSLAREMYASGRATRLLSDGLDPGVVATACLCLALHVAGHPDQAVACRDESLDLASRAGSSFSVGYASAWGATLDAMRQNVDGAARLGGEGAALCSSKGYPLWMLVSTFAHGWARAKSVDADGGLAELRTAIQIWDTTGLSASKPYQWGLLTDLYLSRGERAEGLDAAATGLALATRNGERWYEAELLRLRGELLLLDGQSSWREAESTFHTALEHARAQRALSWELRTAMSLARLWAAQGRHDDGAQLVREVYAKFTEGFDTADLIEARRFVATGRSRADEGEITS